MESLTVSSKQQVEMIDVTSEIQRRIRQSGVETGCVIVFVPHTTAAVTINENADPDVSRDMVMELNKLVPFDDNYRHGEGNSAAHIKSSIIGSSEAIIIEQGEAVLGTWQGIYFCEFDGPRQRRLLIKILSG